MNPSSNNSGMELPPPVNIEQQPPNSTSPDNNSSRLEQVVTTPEVMSDPSGLVNSSYPLTIPLPVPVPPAAPTNDDDQSAKDDGASQFGIKLAQDKDLIEKEWVNKAKAIVEKNRDDPFQQSEDLTMLKADYMKKQFNKTVKLK
jgi:hypothetical protein